VVSKGRHPKHDVANALARAIAAGLSVYEIQHGHRWGDLICEECPARFTINSTPKNAANHAKQIERFVAAHQHGAPRPRKSVS
jgi:hypothetical protein